MYGRKFRTIDELLACDLTRKLGPYYGFSEEYLLKTLRRKPVRPESFCGYMDHAYFSSILLYHMLETAAEINTNEGSRTRPQVFQPAHVDALGAILLHYDLYSYSIASGEGGTKPKLSMDMHPLAWLLLLCDELQCWDRTAYGRNSRKELHPMAVEFDFSKNRIFARYLYDEKEQAKIDKYLWAYVKWKQDGKRGIRPKLKAYSEMANEEKSFVRSIEQLVDTAAVPITVVCDTAPVNRGNRQIYLSNSSFLHIHDFALDKLVIDGELTKERIIAHYQEDLPEYEKQKNYQPFNSMLKLLRKLDGVRIYQYYT